MKSAKSNFGNINKNLMSAALEQAQLAANRGEVPVGAVIASRKEGNIIARAGNMMESASSPLAHAEFLAVCDALKVTGKKFLGEYDLYVTLEPCIMCTAALAKVRIGRIFYGAADIKQGGIENSVRFFDNKFALHKPEIYGGLMEDESNLLLKDFFKTLRR